MLNVDIQLEKLLLSYLVSPSMTPEVLINSKFEKTILYDRDHSLIAKVLVGNLGKKKEVIKSLLQKVSTNPKHFKTLQRIYEVSYSDVKSFKEKDFCDIVERLKELWILRKVEVLLEKVIREDMGSGNAEKCLSNLSKGLFQIRHGTKYDVVDRKDISELASVESVNLSKRLNSIPSGIKAIDRITGGWRYKELIIIGSKPGCGKSCFLMNFGHEAYERGNNVAYVIIEGGLDQFYERYLSMISEIPFDHIRNRELNPVEKRSIKKYQLMDMFAVDQREEVGKFLVSYHNKKKKIDNIKIDDLVNLLIKKGFKKKENVFLPLEIMSNCTLERLEYEIKAFGLKRKLDMLIIDYPGIMTYDVGRSGEMNWFGLSHLYKRLKELAGEYNIVVLGAAQSTENELRYSRGAKDHCDIVFSWDQSDDDKLLNRINMKILKGRNIPIRPIEVREDFSVMKVADFVKEA